MDKARALIKRLLYPPRLVVIAVPPLSFTALVFIFAAKDNRSIPAYLIYGMSAYSLTIWLAAIPGLTSRIKSAIMKNKLVREIAAAKVTGQYLHDPAFRGSISIYQGMTANFLYMIFRVIAGIRYASVWFISMAVYYLVLGSLRAYLIVRYNRHAPEMEHRCYRVTAWLLFLLNIPMGGMILLVVLTNSGYSYPGYIIYLSALYTFYSLTMSVVNLVKFRKLGSPILSAAKVLNFISAMMSILGLQTAMIAQFSGNAEHFRRMMNTITGCAVYAIVIALAVYMLIHSKNPRKQVEAVE